MEDVRNQLALLKSNVAQLKVEQANQELAKADFARYQALVDKGAVSKQQFDEYKAALDVAKNRVSSAEEVVQQTRASLGLPINHENPLDVPTNLDQNFSTVRQALAELLQSASEFGYTPKSWSLTPQQVIEEFYKHDPEGNLDRIYAKLIPKAPVIKQAKAKLEEAKRDLEQAELNLRYCDVVAEIDGVVTRRNVNPGNNVQAGQSLMAVRSLTEIWIDANFKETQLADLRIGQRVALEVDMYGSRHEFEGRITGFTMGTGSTLALLPPQNATGNFVKVVQRLPVRIELTDYDPEKAPLFVGLSVVPYVVLSRSRRPGRNAGNVLAAGGRSSRPAPTEPTAVISLARSSAGGRHEQRGDSHSPRSTGRRSIPGSSPRPSSCRRSWKCSTRRSPTSRCATSPADCRPRSSTANGCITSYLAANAIILPISGWISAHLGRRNYFLLSIAVFTIASGLCGMATSLEQLILFRVMQGLAGGGLQPSSQGVLLDAFPPEKQGAAMTLFGVAALIAPIVGPTLGGYLTDNYNWRWIFYINLPIGAVGLCRRRTSCSTIPRTSSKSGPSSADSRSISTTSAWACWRSSCRAGKSCSARGSSGIGSATRSGACRRWLIVFVGCLLAADRSRAAHRQPRGQLSAAGRAQLRGLVDHHLLRFRRAVRRQHVASRAVAVAVRLRRYARAWCMSPSGIFSVMMLLVVGLLLGAASMRGG